MRPRAAACLVLALVGARPAAAGEPFRLPDAERKIAALESAGAGMVPLFVLGDLDEDGDVDAVDGRALTGLVPSRLPVTPTADVSCPAAGDVDQNGELDERDVATLAGWLEQGALVVPALSFQSYLPCNFDRFVLAASAVVSSRLEIRLRFLAPELTTRNTVLSFEDGSGRVEPSSDGRGYQVRIGAPAAGGGLVVLRLDLPGSRSYYLTPRMPAPTD